MRFWWRGAFSGAITGTRRWESSQMAWSWKARRWGLWHGSVLCYLAWAYDCKRDTGMDCFGWGGVKAFCDDSPFAYVLRGAG